MDRRSSEANRDRRALILGISSVALGGCATVGSNGDAAHAEQEHDEEEGDHAEVTPGEDLMQEHGVLERVLLVYDDFAARLQGGRALDPALVVATGQLVRRFVEDYHEQLEEKLVFPRLERQASVSDLVVVLKDQHVRGRRLTDAILTMARSPDSSARDRLPDAMHAFVRMYRPHASREETVLFPAFRHTFGAAAYREMGEAFEAREHELLGEGGFEHAVEQIGAIEAALGIGDLSKFSP